MRELLSWLMLITDEAWLNHAARIRCDTAVTPQDVEMEDMLFECERLFKQMHEQIQVAAATTGQPPNLAPVPVGNRR
jgi:hypothetical protein